MNLLFAVNGNSVSDVLREKAQSGDIFSQLKLGEEFLYGRNRTQNFNLAFYYFNMAANNGSLEGNFFCGYCYEYGYGVVQNEILAYEFYEKAITLDEAKFKVALFLDKGIRGRKIDRKYYKSIEMNKPQAKKLLDELVVKKYPPAMVYMAEGILQNKNLTGEDQDFVFELLSGAAEKKDFQAKKLLIDCYLYGIGTSKDELQAFLIAKELYSLKIPQVAGKLGYFYEQGIGTYPDMNEAIKLYLEAQKAGDSFAAVKIAEQYLSGFYLKADLEKALEILYAEMKNNNPTAIKLLADCFLKGIGVDKDEKSAFLFYLRASGMGEVDAQYELAKCFREGIGTQIDEGAVFFWLKQGSSLGSLKCMRELGECYLSGYGVEKDLKMAQKLLAECARRGDSKALKILQEVL